MFLEGFNSAKKGTTTIGMVVKEGVVLAADRRATSGNMVANKKVRKILMIDNRIAITTAGGVADAQFLYDIIKVRYNFNKMYGQLPTSIKSIVTYLANILSFNKYFPYYVQLIIGGYDESPVLFSLDLYGSFTQEKYVATGSGSPVAMGVLEDEYNEDLSIDQAVDLARRAIINAIKRDAYTGESVMVVSIDKSGSREYDFPIRKV
jgi:proteasome endopeptidase complex beta subunit